MKKTLKIALVSTLTLAMAFSATLGFAATTHKKTAKHKVKAAVTYPVLTKTSATFKVTNVNKTSSVAGIKTLKVQTSKTAYYTLSNLVPVTNVVKALGGTVTFDTKGLAKFSYDATDSTLQLKAAKGGNAYKIGTVWYANAAAIAPKLVTNYSAGSIPVTFDPATLTFTRSKVAAVGLEWQSTVHNRDKQSTGVQNEATAIGSSQCVRCHNAFVYSNFKFLSANDALVVTQGKIEVQQAFGTFATGDLISVTDPTIQFNDSNFSCYVCHVSNRGGSAKNNGVTPLLTNGLTIKGVGTGAVCMSCHEGRNKLADYTKATAPHHSGQTDLLFGTAASGYRFTTATDSSIVVNSIGNPHGTTENACVGCHMSNKVDGVSNHTMEINGAVACGICHSGLKSVDRMAFGDYDGDKTIEPFQDEVVGLETAITDKIQTIVQTDLATDSTISFGSGGSLSLNATDSNGGVKNVLKDANLGADSQKIYYAAYNVLTIQNDGSKGLHNPAYTIRLLQASYKYLTGNAVPNAQIR